jgi:hypothetical protein
MLTRIPKSFFEVHNRTHAADVLHAASHFVNTEAISKHITDLVGRLIEEQLQLNIT